MSEVKACCAADIAAAAADLVSGDRHQTHGDKQVNHEKIASMWNVYLDIRRVPDAPLDGVDVALMMALLKVARTQLGSPNLDDYVDICGYAACAGEISTKDYNLMDEDGNGYNYKMQALRRGGSPLRQFWVIPEHHLGMSKLRRRGQPRVRGRIRI
jgi:hypothetical protein